MEGHTYAVFTWNQADAKLGDILVVERMLVKHGRGKQYDVVITTYCHVCI